ncbi:MAG: SGNH/GDSL hydrolase family protein [Burkholderiales bacterium]
MHPVEHRKSSALGHAGFPWRMAAVNLALVVVSLIVAAAVVELASWIWLKHFRANHLARWEFRATRPPPYLDADYFGAQFLAEAQAAVSGRLTDVAELADFHGRHFNVVDGFRVTTDMPRRASRRVLMFGGSTLFGQEVPDQHTIASALQRMLNASGRQWEVRNFGLPGMNAVQQTRILRRVMLRKDDLIVYYHGVNDIYYLVFGGYREGWVKGVPAFRPVQKLSTLHHVLHGWHERFKDHSFTAKLALDVYQRGRPSTVTDEAELARNLQMATAQFRTAITEATEVARGADAQFVHFLQPQVFANAQMTEYEKTLVTNPLETPPGVDSAFRLGYPALRAVAESLEEAGVRFVDMSDALDRRAPNEEVFLDFCHLAHRGNAIVARRILDELLRDQNPR